MTICDKCKANKPVHIVYFGGYMLDKSVVPNWDLCDDCERDLLCNIEEIIGFKPRMGK